MEMVSQVQKLCLLGKERKMEFCLHWSLIQKHTQSGSASFTLEVGFIAMLVSAIGVVTTLYTSVNERRKEIGTMKAKGAKPKFILSMFLSDAVFIGFIGASLGIVSGIGLAYLLSASGASGGAPYITRKDNQDYL
jgi:ABC-type antimicrobial peptide transport system permease subunit